MLFPQEDGFILRFSEHNERLIAEVYFHSYVIE